MALVENGDIVDRRKEFPKFVDRSAPEAFPEFVEAVRTVMDLAVSTDAPNEALRTATRLANELAATLAPYREIEEGDGPAGRTPYLPGRGSVLGTPWIVEKFDERGLQTSITLRRFHVGGHSAAHGGVVAHLFDEHLGMILFGRGLPVGRTAYLHVNYRKVTPIGVPLTFTGAVTRVEGRKMSIEARLTDPDGALLADCEALMLRLLPGQA